MQVGHICRYVPLSASPRSSSDSLKPQPSNGSGHLLRSVAPATARAATTSLSSEVARAVPHALHAWVASRCAQTNVKSAALAVLGETECSQRARRGVAETRHDPSSRACAYAVAEVPILSHYE
eukprot:COSAG02_NODE_890_length_16155_cov_63.407885_4_plen_123_part_00